MSSGIVRSGVRGIRLGLAGRPCSRRSFARSCAPRAPGTVRILLPFVTTAAEMDAARAILERARDALAREGVAAPRVPLGAMIEVPAAALAADILAGHADFLALGTNDLAQYLLAADRTDARVTGLVSRCIRRCCACCKMLPRLAARHGLPLSVCGEVASDPVLLALLVGLRRPRVQHDAGGAAGRRAHRRARVARRARHRRRAAPRGAVAGAGRRSRRRGRSRQR